ncbi:MAG: hypothetical protein LAN59_03090 [Acidobacteriia bacterium]|nr:hypothetical protein [Terriglobia bacterium]
MATKHPKPDSPADRGAGYERTDAHIGSLLQFAFWMAVVIAVVMVGMKWTFDYYARTQPLGAPASPLVAGRELPPSPRLQVQPRLELKDYCEAQQQDVNSYAWVDRSSGVVRVPVDRAMDLLLARGLAARPVSEAPDGTAAAAAATPAIAGGMDLQGPCGYLTEKSATETPAEGSGERK